MSGGVSQRHDHDGVTTMACAVSRIVLVSLIFVDREMRDTKLDFTIDIIELLPKCFLIFR